MQKTKNEVRFSAGDLVGHLNCPHLTHLELAAANDVLSRPYFADPMLDILRERGARHEQAFLDHLRESGRHLTRIGGGGVDADSVRQTREAMRGGADVIVQAAFDHGGWVGRADVLMRVAIPSDLGPWSYEVIDTKLSRKTKGGTLLQLSLYAELVGAAQGRIPEFVYVVAPWSDFEPQKYRTADYAAYFRHVKAALEASVRADAQTHTYPEPVDHCEVCRWSQMCDTQRRSDDHLSLVAGIGKGQIAELREQGVPTLAALAILPLPLPWKPRGGSASTYERVREQARVQLSGRTSGQVVWEAVPFEPPFGLCRLPPPSQGDVFFDLEGDPFVGEHGLEYLFGYSFTADDGQEAYIGEWALSREQERAAFEGFVDFIFARLKQYPDLHIYHYAPYEPGALKRLMGRYATREDEVDRLLRGGRFVDLYGVVRQSIRASVESYSIKRLEPLYGYMRATALSDANPALIRVQTSLELSDAPNVESSDREQVTRYNQDDCVSTWRLRDWLETVRSDLIAKGQSIERPAASEGTPGPDLSDWQKRVQSLAHRIAGEVPEDEKARNNEQQARWLLANMLDWHRREKKALWWEFFRLRDLNAEELCDEKAAISGLTFVCANGGTARAPIHRYTFSSQDTDLRGGENLHALGGTKLGRIDAISLEENWVDIKKRGDSIDTHPEAIFAHDDISTQILADSLMRLGECVAQNGMLGNGAYLAARDLLIRMQPRCSSPLIRSGETTLDSAIRVASQLNGGVLPIQGPPGAGKTYTAARMICAFVERGQRVGVTANSHKVIRNLLDAVLAAADELGMPVSCTQKVTDREANVGGLTFETIAQTALDGLASNCNVLGATPWLWASPNAEAAVDVLFIDEAAQMTLVNALAVSQAARTLVLLGDPQQLEQPVQGCHPDGTDVSALDHIIGEANTIAVDRGLFLPETWRLHPSICEFTSELFYDGRLMPRPGLEAQRISSGGEWSGAGLRFLPVPHSGNSSRSTEEAIAIGKLVTDLLATEATWKDKSGQEKTISLDEVLIVAPYNAQVQEIARHLPGGRVGTVDKFQGQEAPVVIYSMTTSSPADAPRGMEFLYSPNRLNVATSRAKCLCVVVGAPTAFEAACRTPRQMLLANAFCRYLELASAPSSKVENG